MLKLKVLGSGSGLSDPLRFQSSIVLTSENGEYIMLDCGEAAAHQLMRYGFVFDNLDVILISHMHADHVAGLPQLLQNMEIIGREKTLKIIMPQEGHKAFQDFLNAIYLSSSVLHFDLNIVSPGDDSAASTENASISFINTNHLNYYASITGNPGECNAFILEYDFEPKPLRIAYSGDMKQPSEVQNLLQKSTDLLIVEMAHFSPQNLFSEIIIADFIPSKILITHIGPDWTNKGDEIKFSAAEKIRDTIIIANDGLELSL